MAELAMVRENVGDNPKVTIVTPSYNQGEYLEKTILSVLYQDYAKIEYIVIDGQSNDNSLDILQRYSDRLAYWVSEEDRGQSSAINKGLGKATGEIVGWLNSDDMLFSSNVISMIVDWFENHPDQDVCFGSNVYIDEDDEPIFFRRGLPVFSKRLLQLWNYIHQPTVYFRSRTLKKDLLNEELEYCLDYELWLRLSERYRFGSSNLLVSASRWHRTSKTVAHSKKARLELADLYRHRGIRFVNLLLFANRIAFGLLRLYGVPYLLELNSLTDDVESSIKPTNLRNLWFRQLLGLSLAKLILKD